MPKVLSIKYSVFVASVLGLMTIAGAPVASANAIEPKAMDLVAAKCTVLKIWSVPSPINFDGAYTIGHAYTLKDAKTRAVDFVPRDHVPKHCDYTSASQYPKEGLFRTA